MKFAASLSQQLSDLTDALDDPGTDLRTILAVLIDDLRAAVPSFLGLRMTLLLAGEPITLAVIEPNDLDIARSSLRLPLDPLAGAGPDSDVVFWARDVDAFTELAAHTRRVYGLDGEVLLDRHIARADEPTPAPAVTDPAQAAVIQQAIGWLIDRGLPPEAAARELHGRSAAAGRSLSAAAQDLLEDGDARGHIDHAP